MHDCSWRVEGLGRWTRDEAISILEGRALVRAVQVAAEGYSLRSCRLLMLGDNLGVVLGAERSRAHSYPLLSCYRRVAAISLARNMILSHRWIFSEMNSSDEPSRVFSETGIRQAGCCVGQLIHVPDPSPGADITDGAKGRFQCRDVTVFDIASDDDSHCFQNMECFWLGTTSNDGAEAQTFARPPGLSSPGGSFMSAREEESYRTCSSPGASVSSCAGESHTVEAACGPESEAASRTGASAGRHRFGGGSPTSSSSSEGGCGVGWNFFRERLAVRAAHSAQTEMMIMFFAVFR